MKYTNYFNKYGKVYGVSSKFEFGEWHHYCFIFFNLQKAEKWLNSEESDFRTRELMSRSGAQKLLKGGRS